VIAPKSAAPASRADYGFGRAATVITDGGRASTRCFPEPGPPSQIAKSYREDSQITENGLVHVQGLKNLSTLNLRGTRITDAALAEFKGYPALSKLDLFGTPVTDTGLELFKGMTYFDEINLVNTLTTDLGEKKLQRALPSLIIIR
jgi:hypothetical protein